MPELKKEISLLGLLALGASGIIGTSWIYTNSKFFSLYGAGGEIFGIAIATVFVVFIALAYAELTSIFPRAGGGVVYSYIAFNRSMAFITGWMLLGAFLASLAFYVMASGMLLSWAFPALEQIPLYSIAGTPVYLPVFCLALLLHFCCLGLIIVV
jgi:amino acid/polyamine/organocation transporter, APC superfamily (TC 2.A.3)